GFGESTQPGGWTTVRPAPEGTAVIAISTSAPGSARWTTTVVRVGGSVGQKVLYTSFIAAKSLAARGETMTAVPSASDEPARASAVRAPSSTPRVSAATSRPLPGAV